MVNSFHGSIIEGVMNSLKNHTNKILEVWSKVIKKPIIKVYDSYKHKQK